MAPDFWKNLMTDLCSSHHSLLKQIHKQNSKKENFKIWNIVNIPAHQNVAHWQSDFIKLLPGSTSNGWDQGSHGADKDKSLDKVCLQHDHSGLKSVLVITKNNLILKVPSYSPGVVRYLLAHLSLILRNLEASDLLQRSMEVTAKQWCFDFPHPQPK